MYPTAQEKISPKMFWMESPKNKRWEKHWNFKHLTDVFSRSARIISNPFQDKLRVSNNFPDQFQDDCQEEPKDPVVNVVRAPEQVEDKPQDQQAEAVGVEHVLGWLWCIPLLHIEGPPSSFVPGHAGNGAVSGVWITGGVEYVTHTFGFEQIDII